MDFINPVNLGCLKRHSSEVHQTFQVLKTWKVLSEQSNVPIIERPAVKRG